MKRVLITAYAINPRKGSEDGTGWNYVFQAARLHKVVAVTRRNNREAIEQHICSTAAMYADVYANLELLYFDWPSWALFWKKGPLLSMIYYYFWQLSVALWLCCKRPDADLVHNLNFHNDWTPSFLWILGKPFVWGPVGHHPRIPAAMAWKGSKGGYLKDRFLWMLKTLFWNVDPFLALTRKKAAITWCMHPEAVEKLSLKEDFFLYPSVAAAPVTARAATGKGFTVLSVGRFVPLKGFDVTIRAFAAFYKALDKEQQEETKLVLVGKGQYRKQLEMLVVKEGIENSLLWSEWLSQQDLDKAYREADILLYPSYEGAGMVVPEAMRYGLPVVCWDNQGPGQITPPLSRLKVPYGTYEEGIAAFSMLLTRLYSDEGFRNWEAKLARERFTTHLDWNLKAKQLENLYDLAMARHTPSPMI